MIGTVSLGSMARAGIARVKASKQTIAVVSKRGKLTQTKAAALILFAWYRDLLANSGPTKWFCILSPAAVHANQKACAINTVTIG
jgi:hypothetical protein